MIIKTGADIATDRFERGYLKTEDQIRAAVAEELTDTIFFGESEVRKAQDDLHITMISSGIWWDPVTEFHWLVEVAGDDAFRVTRWTVLEGERWSDPHDLKFEHVGRWWFEGKKWVASSPPTVTQQELLDRAKRASHHVNAIERRRTERSQSVHVGETDLGPILDPYDPRTVIIERPYGGPDEDGDR